MGYKVKIQEATKPRRGSRLTRLYGIGKEGKGRAYVTKSGAENRAKELRRIYSAKSRFEINVVRTRD